MTNRIAALYNIHGNLPALEAVLDDVKAAAVDPVVVGGDVIPGPMPGDPRDLLLNLRRTTYDLETAAYRIRATSYPDAAHFADINVLDPPSADEMRQRFEA